MYTSICIYKFYLSSESAEVFHVCAACFHSLLACFELLYVQAVQSFLKVWKLVHASLTPCMHQAHPESKRRTRVCIRATCECV